MRTPNPFGEPATRPAGATSSSPATNDIALAGIDGQRAGELLRRAQDEGAAVLGEITRAAVKRYLTRIHGSSSGRLLRKKSSKAGLVFTTGERHDLAEAIAATTATAELLGRSRIRKRQAMIARHAEINSQTASPRLFSEEPTDFSCFDEGDKSRPLVPLAPHKALDWFRSLFPSLAVTDAESWLDDQQHRAFELAVTTEQTILAKVHGILEDILTTGKGVRAAPQTIGRILDEAGLSPRNPAYAETVVRSNLMNAYNRGSQEELKELAEDFPVWRWDGIADGRQRPSHACHFGHYFPASVTFEEVRDSVKGSYDGFNDRCTLHPIYKTDWQALQKQGARIDEGWRRG